MPDKYIGSFEISANWGWKELVENFLYRNYIRFTVEVIEPKKLFTGGPKAIFSFKNLTEKELGLVEGFFQGVSDTQLKLKEIKRIA